MSALRWYCLCKNPVIRMVRIKKNYWINNWDARDKAEYIKCSNGLWGPTHLTARRLAVLQGSERITWYIPVTVEAR